MFNHEFYIQSSANPGEIQRGLLMTANAADFNRMLVAVAYATEGGARILADLLEESLPRWEEMNKEWLLSIDDGFTDPRALRFLSSLGNSTVRIHRAEEALDARLRATGSRFHHKAYLFDGGPGSREIGLFSGSANLTLGGLYRNDEQAVSTVWRQPVPEPERAHYEQVMLQRSLLEDKIATGSPLTDALLSRYEHIREPRQVEDDDVVQRISKPDPVLALPQAAAMATATAMWVEVRRETENRGPGRPGNQIDLARGSRVFFGFGSEEVPPNTTFGTVRIWYGDEPTSCTVRFGNNHMDKLNLPIPGPSGPPTYRNRTLLLERNPDGSYRLTVDAGRQASSWKARSEQRGTSYSMRGGRQFGVF